MSRHEWDVVAPDGTFILGVLPCGAGSWCEAWTTYTTSLGGVRCRGFARRSTPTPG